MTGKLKQAVFVVGVISILLIAAITHAKTPDNSAKLSGSWTMVVTTVNQGVTFPALLTFTADGALIADEPPSPGETSGHGNWMSGDDGSAAFTFVSLFSGEGGVYAGKIKVVGTLQYDASTDSWQGPFKIDGFDADEKATISDTGTFTLTRIKVESMD